jgi:hypothetical protein
VADSYNRQIVRLFPENTPPGTDVSVSCNETTVVFSQVTVGGHTMVTRFDSPPGPIPFGFQFLGDYYDIWTTADVTPPITIHIHYNDADVPGGYENWLYIMHWENGSWVDVTVRPIDTVNNIITAQVSSLSPFALALHTEQFEGFLPPVNDDGLSVFKQKSTVPVKFRLTTPEGTPITGAIARLYLAKVSDSVVGEYQEAVSTAAADTGNIFRYDESAGQYIYNLGTRDLSPGTYRLKVEIDGVVMKDVLISLR